MALANTWWRNTIYVISCFYNYLTQTFGGERWKRWGRIGWGRISGRGGARVQLTYIVSHPLSPPPPCYSLPFMYSLVLTTWICFSVLCRHISLRWYAVFQPTHCYQLCCFHSLGGLCWQEKFIGWVQQKQSYCIKHIFYSYANTP